MHVETKIHDIDDLWKRLMQTWSDFDQDIIDTAIDQQRGHLRCVHACIMYIIAYCVHV